MAGKQRNAVTVTDVTAMRERLQRLDPGVATDCGPAQPGVPAAIADPARGGHGLTQAQCIGLLRELEDLKAAAAGAQAAVTAHLLRSRQDAEEAAGVPADQRGKGLATEVALARRVSPHRGGRHLGLARTLDGDMPHTLAALRSGRLSEWHATLLVRESICVDTTARSALDRELCADPTTLDGWGDKRLVAEAKKVAYRLDPRSVVDRARRAETERCVTLRPAPDTMAYLTALLPVTQAVAALAALGVAADTARATGDDRGRGQLMADTLVARLTGSDHEVPAQVQLQLVMSDRSLLGGDGEPAHLAGYGTVAADWARDVVTRALQDEDGCGVWVRRLFTDLADRLIAMETPARRAPAGLAHYVTVRDGGTCRTPWCDAPVRHIDHVVDYSKGGTTSEENLEGYCERCNYTKSGPGWQASTGPPGPAAGPPRQPEPRAGPTIHSRTPTGHTYTSQVPKLPRTG